MTLEQKYFISYGVILITWLDGYQGQTNRNQTEKEEAFISQSILLYYTLNTIFIHQYQINNAKKSISQDLQEFYNGFFQMLKNISENIENIFQNSLEKPYIGAYGKMIYMLFDQYFAQKKKLYFQEKEELFHKISEGRKIIFNLKEKNYDPTSLPKSSIIQELLEKHSDFI